jgi:hypothetical protein
VHHFRTSILPTTRLRIEDHRSLFCCCLGVSEVSSHYASQLRGFVHLLAALMNVLFHCTTLNPTYSHSHPLAFHHKTLSLPSLLVSFTQPLISTSSESSHGRRDRGSSAALSTTLHHNWPHNDSTSTITQRNRSRAHNHYIPRDTDVEE